MIFWQEFFQNALPFQKKEGQLHHEHFVGFHVESEISPYCSEMEEVEAVQKLDRQESSMFDRRKRPQSYLSLLPEAMG